MTATHDGAPRGKRMRSLHTRPPPCAHEAGAQRGDLPIGSVIDFVASAHTVPRRSTRPHRRRAPARLAGQFAAAACLCAWAARGGSVEGLQNSDEGRSRACGGP